MTTIAYRDGILAADTLATKDGMRAGHVDKIHRLADGSLVASVGIACCAAAIVRWLEGGKSGEQPDGDAAVIHFTAEEQTVYEHGSSEPAGRAPFHAYGCGAPLAIGAMAAGASAEEAVRIAIEYDTLTGGEVQTLSLTPTLAKAA